MDMRLFFRFFIRYFILIFSLTVSISCAFAQDTVPGQLEVQILQPPTPMVAAGKYFLVYELHLTNYQPGSIILNSLEIYDGESSLPLFQFKKQDLANLMHGIGTRNPERPLTLQPGESRMIFMWLPFISKSFVPDQLIHRLVFSTQRKYKTILLSTTTEALPIRKNKFLVISPPLRGDYWVSGNGPSNTSDHRCTNIVVNGHDYFAQRYAIDFIKVNSDGLTYHGDEHKNQSYYCYGDDVLAVSAGKVVEVKNDIPENTPHSGMTMVEINLQTIGGNYVAIDMGNGIYALYGHMIPGSIKVREGNTVKKGQVLGKVGNSGNSSEPHLHFQIVDKPSFIAGNGLPYVFDSFYVRPSEVTSLVPSFQIKMLNSSLQRQTNQLVLENTVIKFPG